MERVCLCVCEGLVLQKHVIISCSYNLIDPPLDFYRQFAFRLHFYGCSLNLKYALMCARVYMCVYFCLDAEQVVFLS